MPNQLSFEVEFTRKQMEELLSNQGTTYIIVSGSYTHLGGNVWKISAVAEGCGNDKIALSPQMAASCIRPCP